MPEERLEQAIALAKVGKRRQAGRLLAEVVQQQPENDVAWLWLAECVAGQARKRACLERALEIDPSNQAAREALNRLDAGGEVSLVRASRRPDRRHKHSDWALVGIMGLVIVGGLGVAGFFLLGGDSPGIFLPPQSTSMIFAATAIPSPSPVPALISTVTHVPTGGSQLEATTSLTRTPMEEMDLSKIVLYPLDLPSEYERVGASVGFSALQILYPQVPGAPVGLTGGYHIEYEAPAQQLIYNGVYTYEDEARAQAAFQALTTSDPYAKPVGVPLIGIETFATFRQYDNYYSLVSGSREVSVLQVIYWRHWEALAYLGHVTFVGGEVLPPSVEHLTLYAQIVQARLENGAP